MPFDPDAYLADAQQPAPFDPEEYLAQTEQQPQAFDPDAYLAGTAESYANLAKRGAWSEGWLAAAQGLEELPRTLAVGLTAGIAKGGDLQRKIRGYGIPIAAPEEAETDSIRALARALADPKSSASRGLAMVYPQMHALDWMADATQRSREQFRSDNPVRPDIAELISGQIVQGVAQAVPTAAAALATGGGAVVPMAVGQLNQEALDDARQKGASEYDARTAATAYLPAAALESFGDLKMVAKIFRPLVGKGTIRQAIGEVAKQVVIEGSTEATQQTWLNAVEKAGFKPDQQLTKGVLDSFLVGGAVGGVATAGGMATSEGARRLADRYSAKEAAALARWGQALQPRRAATEATPAEQQSREMNEALQRSIAAADQAAPAAKPNLPAAEPRNQAQGVAPGGTKNTAAGDPLAEINEILAAEKAQADSQRAEAERRTRAAAMQQRDLPDLVGEALRPRVTDLADKTDLEKHDFWRGMQGLAQTLAGLQTTTTDGEQARRRQLSLEEMREQAGLIFAGAKPELLDAIALKLHGSKPAESVAALRNLYTFAGAQRQPFAAAAEARQIAEQTKRAAAQQAEQQREQEAKAEAKRAAQERARIRNTGRDLAGKVADWTAVSDDELGTIAAATEADGMDPDEITGAQAELERRSREEGQQKPLTREQQLRLIERYGGINPVHPVHAGEIATIRESGIGKNKKLFREDGNTLDTLAQQIRQDVQNGPQTEAEVLEWLSELAAGRAPKLYERGEMDRAEYARSLPPGSRFSVQRPQPHPLAPDRTIPGFNQVDFFEGDRNTRSATLDELRREDYEVPEIPEAMPTGQYSEDQVAGRARWAAAARRSEPLTAGITREQLGAPVRPVDAPAGEWTADNRTNNQRLRTALAPLRGQTIAGVEITKEGIKHLARLQDGPAEFRVAAMLPELLRNSVPVGRPEATDERGPIIQRRIAAALVDGESVPVRITTKTFAGRTTLHHLETAERHSGISRRRAAERLEDRIESGVPAQTVADLLPDVKSQPDGTYTARFATSELPKATATEERLTPQAAKAKEREERRMRRVAPRLFADIDVRIAEVERAMREAGYEGEIPTDAEAVYLPRLRAEKDLIVVGLNTILRGLALPRMLHEGGHAYWRMLNPETREALRRAYQRDLAEQWSPLWRDGELATEVSQQNIREGDQLGLEEWFSELMAALNANWAERRSLPRVPGWIGDLAAKLRDFVQRLFGAVADHKGLQGDERLRFITEDFRAFLTRGQSYQRTAEAGAQFARSEAQFATPQKSPPQPELDFSGARDRFEQADAKVRELGKQLAALENSQDPEATTKGRAVARELTAAKRARKQAYHSAETARAVEADPVHRELAKDPAVRALREELLQLTARIEQARAEGKLREEMLDRRDAIHHQLEEIRRDAEKGMFPRPQPEPPVTFGDANPPRNDDPPKTAQGAEEPDHLRPILIDDFSAFTGPQLAERLARLKQLQDSLPLDLEVGPQLQFLARLIRDTREEMESRRTTLEHEAERTVVAKRATPAQQAREAEELVAQREADERAALDAEQAATVAPRPDDPIPETRPSILAAEPEETAAKRERAAQATLAAEAAAAIPDAPEESYPVRDNVEEVGGQVSASTLEHKSRLRKWLGMVFELIKGFRSSVPELPTFKNAEKFATFREGLRLLKSLDNVVQHEAQEAIQDVTAPLAAYSTPKVRSTQARLQTLRRQAAASPAAKAARAAEIARLEQEMQADPWWIFQNVILYGDLFTRSRLYRRDDGSPISLPGGLNPAEAEHLFKTWLQRAHAHPQAKAIFEARDRHKALIARFADDLTQRGFAFAEGANTNYFPHVMLDHWDGNIAKVQAGTKGDFRSYLITPVGSTKPIETDYLSAMYYHAVQVMAHNKRADILRDYIARENIKQQLIDEAKQARRRDPDEPPITWRQVFFSKDEQGMPRFTNDYSLYAPDPGEVALHPELVIDRDALAHRIGVVLGSGPLQEELKKAGLTSLPLQPSEIHEMLVKGEKELWVLPKEMAEALRAESRRAKMTSHMVTKVLSSPNGIFKKNVLFMLWNWPRYEFNNNVSDLEKVLTADPAMLLELKPALKDVYAFITGDESASADVREAFRLGVLDTLTAAEVGELRKQQPFEAFETKGERNTRVAVNRVTSYFASSRWNTMGWSRLREATIRYAKYKADLARMRNGATPHYAGAYWKNVEALVRVGAPEAIHEQDRTGRLIGRRGAGTGPMASQKPYALAWEQGGRRFEETYATRDERTRKREALEAQQRQADTELVARKAAAISRATFGDYADLTVNGDMLRRIVAPFWSWNEVNFRYHANLFRNMRDDFRRGKIGAGAAAAQLGKQGVALGSFAMRKTHAYEILLAYAVAYTSTALWNAMLFGDDEDDLSEEDRRRLHLLLGHDKDGKVRVMYLQSAIADVLKWFGGNRLPQLVADVADGRTDWTTAAQAYAVAAPKDLVNGLVGSLGPIVKVPYMAIAKLDPFPDAFDQRTIPKYDLRRRIVGQMLDATWSDLLEMAINKDYVSGRDIGDWMQQAILQIRRRDPEQWAFYAIKDKAADYEERITHTSEARNANNAPDAQVLRQFRRAIYQADVPTAVRMYQRLLDYGYTAERFESTVRTQDPLYGLPKAMRDDFVHGLNADERAQLRTAYRYYLRMQEMDGAGSRLFPSKKASEHTRARYQANPRLDVLHGEIQRAMATQGNAADADRRADRAMREALQ